jgi:hypothetical protein
MRSGKQIPFGDDRKNGKSKGFEMGKRRTSHPSHIARRMGHPLICGWERWAKGNGNGKSGYFVLFGLSGILGKEMGGSGSLPAPASQLAGHPLR